MNKTISVKSIPLQYGDCVIKCHKILNYENSTSYVSQFHTHKYYECHFIKKGEALFRTANETVKVSNLQMFIIPPSMSHFSITGHSKGEHLVFEFSISEVDSKPKGLCAHIKKVIDNATLRPADVSENLINIVRDFECSDIGNINEYLKSVTLLTNLFHALFSECEKGYLKTDMCVEATDYETLLDVCLTISDMNMEDIAGVTAHSKRNLSRKLQKKYGMSLSNLRDRQCVKTAMELLESTDCTIEQIAQDAGFKSANSMRTKFKKHVGITPNEFRKLKK